MNAPKLNLETIIDETNAEFTPGEEGTKARAELHIFRPTWDNKPEHIDPCLLLGGERILSPGNMSVLIAAPGAGKSAVCEAIISASIKPDCDSLGLSVRQGVRAAYFDTERSLADHWDSWQRMTRRAGLGAGAEVPAVFELLSLFSSINDRREYIESFLQSSASDFLIIDGLGDLAESVNDEEKNNALINMLLSHAKRLNVGLLATIHGNPNDKEKARGWLGSEAMRKAESVLIIKRDGESGIRTITTDFQHGKNRSATDRLNACFTWDETAQMFLSCDRPEKQPAAQQRQAELIEALRAVKNVYTFTELIEAIKKHTGKTEGAAAKGIYQRLKKAGKLVQNGDLWAVIANE